MKLRFAAAHAVRFDVAPFTGAWIETITEKPAELLCRVAPFTGAWIETPLIKRIKEGGKGRPLHGGVD